MNRAQRRATARKNKKKTMRITGTIGNDPIVLAMNTLTKAIGTPHHLTCSPRATVIALATHVGHLERLTLRPARDSMNVIASGYRVVEHALSDEPLKLISEQEICEGEALDLQKEVGTLTASIMESIAAGGVPIKSHDWLSAMASVLGQLCALYNVSGDEAGRMIDIAWKNTSESDVEEFQRLRRPVETDA